MGLGQIVQLKSDDRRFSRIFWEIERLTCEPGHGGNTAPWMNSRSLRFNRSDWWFHVVSVHVCSKVTDFWSSCVDLCGHSRWRIDFFPSQIFSTSFFKMQTKVADACFCHLNRLQPQNRSAGLAAPAVEPGGQGLAPRLMALPGRLGRLLRVPERRSSPRPAHFGERKSGFVQYDLRRMISKKKLKNGFSRNMFE